MQLNHHPLLSVNEMPYVENHGDDPLANTSVHNENEAQMWKLTPPQISKEINGNRMMPEI